VLFIDLVLIKPQVYRHLLHNTLMRDGDRFDVSWSLPPALTCFCLDYPLTRPQPSILRLGVLLLLFDVYLTWARIEKKSLPESESGQSTLGQLAQQPIVFQYLFFREYSLFHSHCTVTRVAVRPANCQRLTSRPLCGVHVRLPR
jgi:hypothetical protein